MLKRIYHFFFTKEVRIRVQQKIIVPAERVYEKDGSWYETDALITTTAIAVPTNRYRWQFWKKL